MSRSLRRRVALGYTVVLLAGAALLGVATWGAFGRGGGGGCGAVGSSTQDAAHAVTESFVRDVLGAVKPSCTRALATARLVPRLAAVPHFRSRYPFVAYRNARMDSPRTQAVYVVAQPPDGGLQLGADDVPITILSVGLSAPDLGQAGYRVTLTLERGRWLVDAVRRVRIS
jgi:hypothetical protein